MDRSARAILDRTTFTNRDSHIFQITMPVVSVRVIDIGPINFKPRIIDCRTAAPGPVYPPPRLLQKVGASVSHKVQMNLKRVLNHSLNHRQRWLPRRPPKH